MVRPTPRPAEIPADDDEDDVLGGVTAGPKPKKAPDTHPVGPSPESRQGSQVPSHQGTSRGTTGRKKAAAPAEQPARREGGKVNVAEADKVTGSQGGYEGRTKLGARIPDEVKTRLKVASAITRRTEEAIVVEAIEAWLDANKIPNVGS